MGAGAGDPVEKARGGQAAQTSMSVIAVGRAVWRATQSWTCWDTSGPRWRFELAGVDAPRDHERVDAERHGPDDVRADGVADRQDALLRHGLPLAARHATARARS